MQKQSILCRFDLPVLTKYIDSERLKWAQKWAHFFVLISTNNQYY